MQKDSTQHSASATFADSLRPPMSSGPITAARTNARVARDGDIALPAAAGMSSVMLSVVNDAKGSEKSPDTTDYGESVLLEAQRLTHGARRADYGPPIDDYARTAAMASGLLRDKLTSPITASEMAMIMVLVKLSRQINAPKRDNMVDAAGYAWVAHSCAEAEKVAKEIK